MCERICPSCGNSEHGQQYGLAGTTIVCDHCLTILAVRRDIDAAPTSMTYDQAEDWMWAGTFVRPGAEAKDPADDALFIREAA